MKTTIEIDDELLLQAKRKARDEERTLRDLVEQGLRSVLTAAKPATPNTCELPIIRGALTVPACADSADVNLLIDQMREQADADLIRKLK